MISKNWTLIVNLLVFQWCSEGLPSIYAFMSRLACFSTKGPWAVSPKLWSFCLSTSSPFLLFLELCYFTPATPLFSGRIPLEFWSLPHDTWRSNRSGLDSQPSNYRAITTISEVVHWVPLRSLLSWLSTVSVFPYPWWLPLFTEPNRWPIQLHCSSLAFPHKVVLSVSPSPNSPVSWIRSPCFRTWSSYLWVGLGEWIFDANFLSLLVFVWSWSYFFFGPVAPGGRIAFHRERG